MRASASGAATPTPSSTTRTGSVRKRNVWASCASWPNEVLFDAELACGRAADVVPELEALVGQHPMREVFVAQLMTALYRSGRQADALRAFRTHREVLVEELGLDPTAGALRPGAADPGPGSGPAGGGAGWAGPARLPAGRAAGHRSRRHRARRPPSGRRPRPRDPGRPPGAGRPARFRARRSRPPPSGLPRCATRRSSRSTITGGSPAPPTWCCAACTVARWPTGSNGSIVARSPPPTSLPWCGGSALPSWPRARPGSPTAGSIPASVLFDEAGDAWLTDFDLTEPGRDPATTLTSAVVLEPLARHGTACAGA